MNAMACSKADRIVGSILGAALGDAVGLCTEFLGVTTLGTKITWELDVYLCNSPVIWRNCSKAVEDVHP